MENKQVLGLNELHKYFEDQLNIIIMLNISIENMLRLKIDKYQYEKEIKLNQFFQNYWFQCKFIAVIQLTKLLSSNRNERRSFKSFCKRLEGYGYSNELIQYLSNNASKDPNICKSKSEIQKVTSKVRNLLLKNDDLIKKVEILRKKFYAHKDEKDLEFGMNSEELSNLTILAKEIFNILYFQITWTTFYFENFSLGGIDKVLFHLNFSKECDLKELARKKKPAYNNVHNDHAG